MLVAVPKYTRRYTYITNGRHVIYVLLDAIFVSLIHWFAPVDIDQPSIGCGSSDFAAKKTPKERPALAMWCAPKHVHVAWLIATLHNVQAD
jgi:hypothetical protein